MSEASRFYFEGRRLAIATMHAKEIAIAPLLEAALGVKCEKVSSLNTDILGTFSGEVERIGTPIDILRKKCALASELTGADLVIASEGSFGPHPFYIFVNANEEHILLKDKKNDLEIYEKVLSAETNFGAREIHSKDELSEFVHKVRFPSHAIILKDNKSDFNELRKGITSWQELLEGYDYFYNKFGSVYAETDMRAMFNPTRMKQIEKLTKKLLDKICSLCPQCKIPGFGIEDVLAGLPCEYCHAATKSTLAYVFRCRSCSYSETKPFPKGKFKENPMYCDHCNP